MPAVASIDGVLAPLADARVPVTDRGLLFGDHVFEIARARGPRVIDGDAHLARLSASARAIGIAAPTAALVAWIDGALAAAREPDAALRVIWTRGDGASLRPRPGAAPRAIVIVEPLGAGGPDEIRLASIAVGHAGRTGALVPATAKTGSYLASVLALARAAELDADDALLVDPDGLVLETATASLFAVIDGRTVAAAAAHALPGVTAARVAALLGDVVDAPVTRASLDRAAEIFVTSSRRGVVPVAALDGRAVVVGPTTRRARAAYDAWVQS